jgi:hypothetical protein
MSRKRVYTRREVLNIILNDEDSDGNDSIDSISDDYDENDDDYDQETSAGNFPKIFIINYRSK